MGRGNWGVILSSATGQEWQLFIMSKMDMLSAPFSPTSVLSPANQPITTTASLTLNPVEQYAAFIARKCPNTIDVEGPLVKFKNMNEEVLSGWS